MTNYSNEANSVRVDFWKPSGKWKYNEAVKWTGDYDYERGNLIHASFAKSLRDHFGDKHRLEGLRATCLDPYHQHAHPISIDVSEIWGYEWTDPNQHAAQESAFDEQQAKLP